MFKIVATPRAWWPVIFNSVADDGSVYENSFKMRFILHDEDESIELQREIALLGQDNGDLKMSKVGADIVQKLAEDWKDVARDDGSEGGQSLPFTRENIELVVRQPNVFFAIARAYRACRAAAPEALAGN